MGKVLNDHFKFIWESIAQFSFTLTAKIKLKNKVHKNENVYGKFESGRRTHGDVWIVRQE